MPRPYRILFVCLGNICRHDDLRVPDPCYRGQRGFDHVIELLKDGCEGILEAQPPR